MAKYKSKTEQGQCIFCGIVNGKVSTPGVFWENENYMAFLSKWPNTEGTTVVIPKKHFSSDVLSMTDRELAKFMTAAKEVSQLLIHHFDDVGRVGLVIEGTGIDHAHIKLFPMHGTPELAEGKWKQFHSENNTYFDQYKGYISSHDGPEADEAKLRELANGLKVDQL